MTRIPVMIDGLSIAAARYVPIKFCRWSRESLKTHHPAPAGSIRIAKWEIRICQEG
jgi:hypothetical protein